MTGATVEPVVASGITTPCGIDYRDGRIAVSDNTTGNIYVYNVNTTTATLIGNLITGCPGVMGVQIDDGNRIWYVNKTTNKVYRIDNPNVLGVNDVPSTLNYSVYPNPATNVLNISLENMNGNNAALIRVFDVLGRQAHSTYSKNSLTTINTGNWAKGVYNVAVSYEGTTAVSKVIIQ